jgi:uncharacterized membrane protein
MRKPLTALALTCALLLAATSPAAAQDGPDTTPPVRAILFYSTECGHCEALRAGWLAEYEAQHTDDVVVLPVEISVEPGASLIQEAIVHFAIPQERMGVPTLVIGDNVLVGAGEIEPLLPGLVDGYLAAGGVDWPAVPGIEEAVAQLYTPPAPPTWRDRFDRDPAGNGLSVVVLAGMLVALVAVLRPAVWRRRKAPRTRPAWLVPALALVGLAIAAYLTYIETTLSEAVCPVVGDCNAVQQSEYARLLGVPVAALGLLGYLAVLAAWAVGDRGPSDRRDMARAGLFAVTVVGVLFSAYLTFLEPFVIGATCTWCLSSAVIMTALMLLTATHGRPALRALTGRPSAQPGRARRGRASR